MAGVTDAHGVAEAHPAARRAGHRDAVLLTPPDNTPRCFSQISVGGHVVRCGMPNPHPDAPHLVDDEIRDAGDPRALQFSIAWEYVK